MLVLAFPLLSFSQNFSKDTANKIIAKFDTLPYRLKEGQIISKTLRVDNKSSKSLTFTVDVIFPPKWKTLNSRSRNYTISPGDSIFVPVRIIPHGKIIGNTKYLINAYVLELDSTPVATSHFYVIREKLSSWELAVSPKEKIYFLNKENTSAFNVNIINTGNENQELLLDFENNRTNILLYDTNDKVITKTLAPLYLKPNQDTSFKYKVKYANAIRNYRLIDMDGYRPNTENESHTYTLFAKTSEPKAKHASANQKAKRIDFVKLSDKLKANPYGQSSVPIVFDATVSNLVGGQPILNLNLRGTTFLENGATVNYFSQIFFSTNYYTNQYLLGSSHYIGYYDTKYQFELGNVGGLGAGTFGGGGRGATARYTINKMHKVGAFYTRSPRLFKAPSRESYGAMYQLDHKLGRLVSGFSRVVNHNSSLKSNYASLTANYIINSKQSISLYSMFGFHNSSLIGNIFKRNGFETGIGYSAGFLENNRLRVGSNITYSSKFFNAYNAGELWSANANGSFNINKKWTIQSNNFYNKIENKIPGFSSGDYTIQNFRNSLNIGTRIGDYFITPGLFYNINRINNNEYHSRGLNATYGNYNFETNRLLSNTIMTGYNRTVGAQPLRDYFFFQYFFIFRYKTISSNIRYTYGNITSLNNSTTNLAKYPQSVGLSFNYQYQFRDPHFILQNFFSYSYYNRFERHSLAYAPEIYYYTNDGWRFRLGIGYFLTRSNASGERIDVDNNLSGLILPEPENVYSKGVNIIFGARKEFGIPIPYTKKKYFDADFIAFIDLNGNKKKDGNEYVLENVVIGLNKMEVLTNEKGKASIKNLAMDKYTLYAFSLIDLDGYFPYIDEELEITKHRTDTNLVYIPFVKGIKIFGKVEVEREDVAKNTELPLDLSGIKISAINGKQIYTLTERDGSFNFYVPYGKYVLNMDENILGEKFKILQNNIELELDMNTENLFITFYVIEQKRKITKKRFDANGNLIDDTNGSGSGAAPGSGSGTGMSPGSPGNQGPLVDRVAEANAEAAKVRPIPVYDVAKDAFLKNHTDLSKTQGLMYTVQIGSFQKPLNPKVFDGMKQLHYERIDKNFVRICAGKFESESSAAIEKDNLIRVGFPGAYVTAYYNGKSISLAEAAKLKK